MQAQLDQGPAGVVTDKNEKDGSAAIRIVSAAEPNLTMTTNDSPAGVMDDALSFWDSKSWEGGELPRLLSLSGTKLPTGFSEKNG